MLHPRNVPSNRVLVVLLLALAVVAAACSGGSSVETGERPDLPRSAAAASSPLPEVAVWDVGDSEWVQFADLVPADKPVLLWFWAPHCPACAAEAPGMKEFSEAHADTVEVIGIGTQDDAGMAADFVEQHGIPFQMLWDESFETWAAFGISAQPATALFSADGEMLGGWMGGMPEEQVLELLAAQASSA